MEADHARVPTDLSDAPVLTHGADRGVIGDGRDLCAIAHFHGVRVIGENPDAASPGHAGDGGVTADLVDVGAPVKRDESGPRSPRSVRPPCTFTVVPAGTVRRWSRRSAVVDVDGGAELGFEWF